MVMLIIFMGMAFGIGLLTEIYDLLTYLYILVKFSMRK